MYLRHVRWVNCREIASQPVDLNESHPWHRLLENAHCETYIDAENPKENATGKTCAQAHYCWNSLKVPVSSEAASQAGIRSYDECRLLKKLSLIKCTATIHEKHKLLP